MNDSKIINDPVFGFIKIPYGLLLDIVKHPLMQRLTRIKQLGLASMVYPGAQHTRFQHSIGALHLMSEAITSLSQKGIFIFDSEAEAVEAAILMHDIGHGPFSHVLEDTLISGISHEDISLMMMEEINVEMNGNLNLALKIFKDEYPKKFLHQLISSQLDRT
jgi:HD superfamily phosphohydrolase